MLGRAKVSEEMKAKVGFRVQCLGPQVKQLLQENEGQNQIVTGRGVVVGVTTLAWQTLPLKKSRTVFAQNNSV